MDKIFSLIYQYFNKHRNIMIIALIVITLLSAFFASKIKFDEDISGFLPKSKETEDINFIMNNIGISDKIIVRISDNNNDMDELEDASERFVYLADSIIGSEHISKIFYKVDQSLIFSVSDFISSNFPYFLNDDDYSHLAEKISKESINKTLEGNKQLLTSPIGAVMKKTIVNDPLHFATPILQDLQKFQISDEFINIDDYIFTKNGKEQIVLITSTHPSSETAQNKIMITKLKECIKIVSSEFDDNISIRYFGAADIAVTNASRIKKDSILSIIIASILIIALMIYFFRRFNSIVLIILPIIFGGIFSLAMMYFFKGNISAIAIGAGSIIFGIAINYSLHYLVHVKYVSSNIQVIKDISSPLIIGGFTTIAAFLSLIFISSKSMSDFGLFAAFTLIGTSLFVLIFLPHFLSNKIYLKKQNKTFLERISEYNLHQNKALIAFITVITIILLFFTPKTTFEGDMNAINYMTTEQKTNFEDFAGVTNISKTSLYNISEGKNLDDALCKYESNIGIIDSLIVNGDLSGYTGIRNFLPSKEMQTHRLKKWNEFLAEHKTNLTEILASECKEIGFKTDAFNNFLNTLDKNFEIQDPEYFSILIENFLKDYLISTKDRSMVISLLYSEPTKVENIKSVLGGFTFDSGTMMRNMINTLSKDFDFIVYICGIIVFFFLIISFKRIELSVIAFLPMLISWVWILGIMGIFDIRFNIVNIILATFIFGLGDDYTIFIVDGLMSEYSYGKKKVDSFKSAVSLSAITMFIGIGSLIIAKHPAMQSLAQVTIIGMLSVVLMAFVIPPIFFNAITKKKGKTRKTPVTLTNWLATFAAFVFFLFGSLFITISGFFLLTIGGKTEKHKLKYHKLLQKFSKFCFDNLLLNKTTLINYYKETFDKQGIIISNHQSHLDLIIIMMLNPKIIILTNEWVWKSPFYGILIRYADYLPIHNGIEDNVDKLRHLYNAGYSIMVFPEGTRSEDCSILRFHKGAFYLAEQLKADIIPILIHGAGHTLPKSELLLRKGKITVEILNRIYSANQEYGKDYTERTKSIRKMYINEYQRLSNEIETPQYFHNLVIGNYKYKVNNLENIVRKQLKDNNNFTEEIAKLPKNGTICIDNCNYGVYPLIAALVNKNLQIIATDKDDDKVLIAQNCASVPKNLSFVFKDSESK
ncbi:1-acyl-sn-glycerol-3-phosphate acyltransferase [Odoribacter sp. OttesenSCG-928-L07]|nr:1-acyl-sn-glycerol-3-phosphate acyltransferase [Odoribacter sp. OttesenSCG-928-L07]MDL2238888.1 1-acyl-sn-glycerol-3-phosphate acyltransferase [Bacteroidales bacterium OttesenSCG-928-L14]MDL2240628.1 1-acyl-sn-glycerol-3-phosphate acyltransferase [Bacteroidales bacterium OttesenSCG-928-K22]